MSEERSFLAELKRRNVYKVAVAYAVVGWLIAQIATQIFPFLEIPNWIVRLVIVLIAIGFPIALMIAWAFEATSEGIKRTEVADAMPMAAGQKNARMDLRCGCWRAAFRWTVLYWSLQRGNEVSGGLTKSISGEIDCCSSFRKPERR